MSQEPEQVLVFRIGQIGDTVAALPSLWTLRKQFPNARIVMLSEIPAKQNHLPPESVLPQTGLVDGFEKYPGGTSVKNFIAAWRQIKRLRRQGFDTLVYLAPSGRTPLRRLRDQWFFRVCGIKRMLATKGFAKNFHPKLPNGALSPQPREADALLHRLKLDGLPVPDPGQGCMDLRISEPERERVGNWWKQNIGLQKLANGWFAICVGGKTSTQLWPWERYAEVVRLLMNSHGIFPLVIGGKEDRALGKKLLAALGTGLCAAGELSVRESAALAENARFYLGNDTGAMHLAAAVGIPCVAIFSARNWPGIWEPYGNGHKVLRFDVPCSGCKLEVCDKELQCLKGIQVGQVYRACVEIMSETKATGSSKKS